MATTQGQYSTTGGGLLPSATLQPYGKEILKYGIGQLGTPIDVGYHFLLRTLPFELRVYPRQKLQL